MNNALSLNQDKATEAIALFLKLNQKPMILSKLLKMMFFVDRIYLAKANRSLTNDCFACQSDGLIPKYTTDLILQLQLLEIIAVSDMGAGYVSLLHYPKTPTLTPLESKIVKYIYGQKKNINPFNILDWKYNLSFIKQHLKDKRNKLITPLDIMVSLGKTDIDIQEYLDSQIALRANISRLKSHTQEHGVSKLDSAVKF